MKDFTRLNDSLLSRTEIALTADWIVFVQEPTGMIPWYPGGHANPWDHVEATMALTLSGRHHEAERGLEWLRASQHPDGSWCTYYLGDEIEEARRDPNVCAYVATGVWCHHLQTDDYGVLVRFWAMVERAVDFVLQLQQPGGEVLWTMDPDGTPGRYALLTASSSIHHSLRCALAIAERLGHERPEWELAAGRLAFAIAHRPDAFEPKDRFSMDWYYPVLSGAVSGHAARSRLLNRWDEFVVEGLGVRCVADRPWVTAAETAECALALDAAGLPDHARTLVAWSRHLREESTGAYWTGCAHPECVRFPEDERSTFTAAAVVVASWAMSGLGPAAGLFRGETLPAVLDLAALAEYPSPCES